MYLHVLWSVCVRKHTHTRTQRENQTERERGRGGREGGSARGKESESVCVHTLFLKYNTLLKSTIETFSFSILRQRIQHVPSV